jgi:hypothetical protein
MRSNHFSPAAFVILIQTVFFSHSMLFKSSTVHAAGTLPCGPIFKKAKQLPKGSKGKAPCVLETQVPGEFRGSFVTFYSCDGGKTKYKLVTYEDLSCEAQLVK